MESKPGVSVPNEKSEFDVPFPFKSRLNFTWKIKQVVEKKSCKTCVSFKTLPEKPKNKTPALKCQAFLAGKFPFYVSVHNVDVLKMKIWILDEQGLKRKKINLIKKEELNGEPVITFMMFECNPDSNDSGYDPNLIIIDLIYNNTLTVLFEVKYLEVLVKPEPQRNTHTGQTCKGLLNMFEDGELTDCTVVCEGTRVPCHKAVLSANSSVFKAMLTLDMKEKLTDEVNIVDLQPEAVEMMIRFMYAGKVDGLEENAASLLPCAEKYNLNELKVVCEIALIDQLSVANCLDTLILADSYRASDLKNWTLEFITRRAVDVVAQPEWMMKMRPYPDLLMEMYSFKKNSLSCVSE